MSDNTEAKAQEVPVGTLWEIEARANVEVSRPDGRKVTVASFGGIAGHMLDVPGEYTAVTASGKTESVKAG